jgi:hypothetical protein
VLDIAATGTVVHDTATNETVSPDGLEDPWYHQFNVPGLPDANTVALIGSINGEQPYFVVGSETTYECRGAGAYFSASMTLGEPTTAESSSPQSNSDRITSHAPEDLVRGSQ